MDRESWSNDDPPGPQPCASFRRLVRSFRFRSSVDRSALRAVLVASCLEMSGVGGNVAAAAGSAPTTGPALRLNFDIPAQALVSALDVYSTITGREVFYDGAYALDRRSAKVSGTLPPDIALRILLRGTDFVARSTGPHSFTIVLAPQLPAARESGRAEQGGDYAPYFASLQASLKQALCRNVETRPGAYQAVVRFWLAPSGAVRRAELLNSTGSRDRDSAFAGVLRAMKLAEPPPAAMPQPVTMVVLPRRSGQAPECTASRVDNAIGPPARPVGAPNVRQRRSVSTAFAARLAR
jgi:TonB family protein